MKPSGGNPHTIARREIIPVSAINSARYTESLLCAAVEYGVMGEAETAAVQGGLFDLLAQRLDHLTDHKSCTVRTEIAQMQLANLLYVLDMRLSAEASPDGAAELLLSRDLSVLYEEGLRRIKRKQDAGMMQYRRLLSVFTALPESVFRRTAVDGIAAFLKTYQPEYWPGECVITADYPLYNPVSDGLQGVSFVAAYLQGMSEEAAFLSRFKPETLTRILRADNRMYETDAANLFRPMFTSVIGMVLLGKPFSAWKYGLDAHDAEQLSQMTFDGDVLSGAFLRVKDYLMLPRGCAEYCRRALPKLLREITAAQAHGVISHIFPCSGRESVQDNAPVTNVRMSPDAFRCLVYDLRECTSCEERAQLILSRAKGIEDIYDILLADDGTMGEADVRCTVELLSGQDEALVWLARTLAASQPFQREEERRLWRILCISQDRES